MQGIARGLAFSSWPCGWTGIGLNVSRSCKVSNLHRPSHTRLSRAAALRAQQRPDPDLHDRQTVPVASISQMDDASTEPAYDDPVPAAIVDVAQRAADAARVVIRKWFRSPALVVQDKSDASPVTVADREAEQAMRRIILETLPNHVVLGEEEGGAVEAAADAEYSWVLDPIDGTKAFMTGKPTFGTLIAVLRYGTPVFGIIDQPITDERWMGGLGWSATLNGSPALVKSSYPIATTSQDADKLLAGCIVHATHPDMFIGLDAIMFRRLAGNVKQVMYGSDCYAYALLASGHVDVVLEADLKLWDFAALVPVVQAAGGVITDWDGEALDIYSNGRVLASPSTFIQSLVLNILNDPPTNVENGTEGFGFDHENALPADPGPGHVESMTGYGSGEACSDDFRISVQLRCVNSRYCEVQFRGPRFLAPYESELTSIIKRSLSRGRVVCTATMSSANSETFVDDRVDDDANGSMLGKPQGNKQPNLGAKISLSVDTDAVVAARQLLDRIARTAGVASEPTIADILTFSEVLVKRDTGEGMDHLVPIVKEALSAAIGSLMSARRREGAILQLDMLTRCAEIKRVLAEIERRAPDRVATEHHRLRTRVDELVRGAKAAVETRGLEQEIALFADRVDITEETVRLGAHVQLFELAFAGVAEPIGQRLLFLLQEMHREASTISSKANDAPIAHLSVLIKQEIEKIREQVQNLC